MNFVIEVVGIRMYCWRFVSVRSREFSHITCRLVTLFPAFSFSYHMKFFCGLKSHQRVIFLSGIFGFSICRIINVFCEIQHFL